MPSVTVKFFGPARDLADTDEIRLELGEGERLGALAGRIAGKFDKLGRIPGFRLAVNRSFVPLDHKLNDGDEVAVIPPVSGG